MQRHPAVRRKSLPHIRRHGERKNMHIISRRRQPRAAATVYDPSPPMRIPGNWCVTNAMRINR